MSRRLIATLGIASLAGLLTAVAVANWVPGGQAERRVPAGEEGSLLVSRAWGGYPDLDTLARQSHLVVVATIQYGNETRVNDQLALTDFTMAVLQVLKGEAPGDTISVRQTGGHDAAGRIVQVEDDPLMEHGVNYLLFLWEGEGGGYYVWAGPEGRFVVRNGLVDSLSRTHPDRHIDDLGLSGAPLGDIVALVARFPAIEAPDRDALLRAENEANASR